MKRYNKLSIKKINTTNIKDFAKAEAIPYTSDSTDYYIKRLKMLADPKRALALADNDKIIGTANSFSEYISLPTNKSSKVAAVSYVSVQPTHRRQGILSEMMKLQLNQIYSQYKEPLAILWPSETAIYGRFGYAPTREKHYKISKHNAQFISGLNDCPLETKILNKKEAINSYLEINNNLMNKRPGVMKLTKKWAERRIEDLSSKYLSPGRSYFVGIYDADKIVGFVTYSIEGNNEYGNMPTSLNIWDIIYLNDKAAINIWNYCLNIDLVDEIYAKGVPEDDVLESLLISPGSLHARVTTGFWIRIVDVIKALENRSYNEKGKLIFKLSDSIINQNNNTFLLDTKNQNSTCKISTESPDIEITINGMSEIYLGTFNLNNLIASQNIKIMNKKTINFINRAFKENNSPFCPMHF